MSSFWQAPGNAKGFDSFLGDNSKMNSRTIGVLSYIKKVSIKNGYVSELQFKKEIKSYLQDNFNENPNDSLDTHFYKPALFYGFIYQNKNKDLMLSIEGNLFLIAFEKDDYIRCKELIINQLDDTKYPNDAVKNIKNLKLFPFRILFKLLLDNESLNSIFISKSLVHVAKYTDLKEYIKTKDINSIKNFKIDSSKYKKFNTWVINSLVDLKILVSYNGYISICQEIREHIETLYKNIDYKDMFFDNVTCELNASIAYKRTKRDPTLIAKAKQRDNYTCTANHLHKTFKSRGKNYVEGHHIIPMYQQKNYTFTLDNVDNITSLCPNCHREMHSADDKLQILTKLYKLNSIYMRKQNIKLNDLCKMYLCNIYHEYEQQ